MNTWQSLAMKFMCTLEDVITASSQLVKQGGKVAFVHRPGRLLDIVTLMRAVPIRAKADCGLSILKMGKKQIHF